MKKLGSIRMNPSLSKLINDESASASSSSVVLTTTGNRCQLSLVNRGRSRITADVQALRFCKVNNCLVSGVLELCSHCRITLQLTDELVDVGHNQTVRRYVARVGNIIKVSPGSGRDIKTVQRSENRRKNPKKPKKKGAAE